MKNTIPDKVFGFNVYDETEKLLGISGEVTLPSLESMSETISGAGILGEIDSPTVGHFGSLTIDIPFRTLLDQSFSLLKNKGKLLVLRGVQQGYDSSTGEVRNIGVKISLRGIPKGLELGKLVAGGQTDTKNSMEVTYMKIEVSGKAVLELDKLNHIYKIQGEDMLKDINKYL